MEDRILVRFQGPGAGVGELTWGQQAIWTAMKATDSSLSMAAAVEVPAGKTAEDLAAELEFMMSRYESMRSRLRFDSDGNPSQVVSGSGEIAMPVLDLADADDPAEVARGLAERWEGEKFDYAGEWPMRMAAIRHRGVTTHVVVVLSHFASDGGGVGVMMRELAERDPTTGQAKAPAAAVGPLELALAQRAPSARRQSEISLRYWERLLRETRPQRFGPPADLGGPRFREVASESPALYLAAQVVAARTRVAASTVHLAAYLVGLGRLTGVSPVVCQAVVSNRFRPGLADVSHPVCENGLLLVDVADCTFDEVVDRTHRASMQGSKYAYYDPIRLAEVRAAVESERGTEIDLACVFNHRRPGDMGGESGEPVAPEDVWAAVDRRTLRWNKPLARFPEKIMLTVDDVPDTVALRVQLDTHYVPPAAAEALLLDMETVVVAAAFDAGTPTGVKS